MLSKNTKSNKRRGQVFKPSDKGSIKDKWDELENNYQQSKSRDESEKEKSESSHFQTENNSSVKENTNKKRDSIEQQDNESVKALLTGFEDLTLDINDYFKRNYGTTDEVYNIDLKQLNDPNNSRERDQDYYY